MGSESFAERFQYYLDKNNTNIYEINRYLGSMDASAPGAWRQGKYFPTHERLLGALDRLLATEPGRRFIDFADDETRYAKVQVQKADTIEQMFDMPPLDFLLYSRETRNKTHRNLADKASVKHETIRLLEYGRIHEPDTYEVVLKALRVLPAMVKSHTEKYRSMAPIMREAAIWKGEVEPVPDMKVTDPTGDLGDMVRRLFVDIVDCDLALLLDVHKSTICTWHKHNYFPSDRSVLELLDIIFAVPKEYSLTRFAGDIGRNRKQGLDRFLSMRLDDALWFWREHRHLTYATLSKNTGLDAGICREAEMGLRVISQSDLSKILRALQIVPGLRVHYHNLLKDIQGKTPPVRGPEPRGRDDFSANIDKLVEGYNLFRDSLEYFARAPPDYRDRLRKLISRERIAEIGAIAFAIGTEEDLAVFNSRNRVPRRIQIGGSKNVKD